MRVPTKRVVAIGDLHCGHLLGLTPPDWWTSKMPGHESMRERSGSVQRELWKWYTATMAALQPIDILLVNGDVIDGKGRHSGGVEQITTDRRVQCEMAAECIGAASPKRAVFTYGTRYHTGKGEDWEAMLADQLSAAGMDVDIDNYVVIDVWANDEIGRASCRERV